MKYSLSAKNLVCRNLEAYAGYRAGLFNPDHTKEITGIVRSDSGLPSVGLNQVISNMVMPPRIFQRFAVDYFAERRSPFTLWHSASKPLDDAALEAVGLKRRQSQVAMAVEIPHLSVGDASAVDKLTISAVQEEDLPAYGAVQAAVAGEQEGAQLARFYEGLQGIPEQRRGRLKLFLASLEGTPVAAGCLFAAADALGLYDLVTLKSHQQRGIGRALFYHLADRACSSHHRNLVALVPADRQQLLLDSGFFAVGEVARYQFAPQ
ncbi:GNAT family N-acetyltransferase [Microbulbifer sp. OS29]|uniref:GNAT family N-acetyltransferase n=1 Tax=Microbulbifer okhotskensis TaxID=2926617 RepID=A0A9X2ER40_9GAMM|nr:GNAT family N-acetyltransferase [Microbulbifer okhotskensis]MCO1334131.1 GNAT family N-acetyltransferase [Microbulbifer okhotskensis]